MIKFKRIQHLCSTNCLYSSILLAGDQLECALFYSGKRNLQNKRSLIRTSFTFPFKFRRFCVLNLHDENEKTWMNFKTISIFYNLSLYITIHISFVRVQTFTIFHITFVRKINQLYLHIFMINFNYTKCVLMTWQNTGSSVHMTRLHLDLWHVNHHSQ